MRRGASFQATDGTPPKGRWDMRSYLDAWKQALLASTAHDLPCDREVLSVVTTGSPGRYDGDRGCGYRVTYDTTKDDEALTVRLLLTGRVPVGAPASGAPTE